MSQEHSFHSGFSSDAGYSLRAQVPLDTVRLIGRALADQQVRAPGQTDQLGAVLRIAGKGQSLTFKTYPVAQATAVSMVHQP